MWDLFLWICLRNFLVDYFFPSFALHNKWWTSVACDLASMIFWLKFSFLQAELNNNSDWLDLNTSWLPSANIYILMGILWVPCLHYGETSTCSIWVGGRKGFFHQIKLCTGMTCTAYISHFLTKFSGLHFEVGGGDMHMSKRVCSCSMKAAWLWIPHDESAGTCQVFILTPP